MITSDSVLLMMKNLQKKIIEEIKKNTVYIQ